MKLTDRQLKRSLDSMTCVVVVVVVGGGGGGRRKGGWILMTCLGTQESH